MIKRFSNVRGVIGLSLIASVSLAAQAAPAVSDQTIAQNLSETKSMALAEPSALSKAEGIITLDYQIIPVPGSKSIDLIGFHVFNKLNDWMYLGVGGHAPVLKGEYGGFMVFDVTAHAQRKIFGNVFANAGVSLGGGGGGRSVAHSRILSGTGGFVKGYVGLGYDFDGFSVGANIARTEFKDSSIKHSQLNIFVQAPFSYSIGSYARSGESLFAADISDAQKARAGASESMLTFGLDNLSQIDPQGLNKGTINKLEIQYSYFMAPQIYWFFNAGGGYRGRPLYNEVFGGMGYRARISPRVNVYSQLGVGSGGYAPETIDTGPGLLIYPKIFAEYMIRKNLGLSISGGYMFAPKGSSRNYTFGASLHYHIHAGDGSSSTNASVDSALFKGYRLNLFQQTELNVKFKGAEQPKIKMLSMQIDNILNDHVYIPVQVSVAYNPYLTYPGYGEVLFGVGVQNRFHKNDRFQFFGQLMAGANPHGAILKTGIGLNYGLNDRWAIYAVAGQTLAGLGSSKEKFSSDYLGLGLTYRFAVPSW